MGLEIEDLLGILNRTDLRHGFHYSEKFNALYVEVPKCACSSIKRRMQNFEAGILDGHSLAIRYLHQKKKNPNALLGLKHGNVKGLSPKTFLRALQASSVYKFSFVRNPYGRLISAYKNKILKKNKARIMVAQTLYGKSSYTEAEMLEVEISFEDFVKFVISHEDPINLNVHWRPQVSMLLSDYVDYDFVGRLESIDADWRVVHEKVYPYEYVPLSRENSSGWNKNYGSLGYTPELADMVYEYYRRDFEMFGYSRESYLKKE